MFWMKTLIIVVGQGGSFNLIIRNAHNLDILAWQQKAWIVFNFRTFKIILNSLWWVKHLISRFFLLLKQNFIFQFQQNICWIYSERFFLTQFEPFGKEKSYFFLVVEQMEQMENFYFYLSVFIEQAPFLF
jgi:hypothetical protein